MNEEKHHSMEDTLPEQTRELLFWYDRYRRHLPWREDPTPYHVWLSEIILQQTRVEAGKAYYLRFLAAFPDIASLAAASEEEYLKLWEGLGYYSRVRNLHKAAVRIMEEYGGEMPHTAKELQRLPGIGPYSAAAIASIAFGEPVVSVDGNLLRIFSRLTEYREDVRSQAAKHAAGEYYSRLISPQRPGDFNQALMDLGASVCIPNGAPLCEDCPWMRSCASCGHRTQMLFPVVAARKPRRVERKTVLLLRRGDRIAVRKRPDTGLLAGLYEFPSIEGCLGEVQLERVFREMGVLSGADSCGLQRLPDARHVFTHVEWHMIGYGAMLPPTGEDRADPDGRELLWADSKELSEKYAVPSAFETYRRIAMDWLRTEAAYL